MARSVDISMLGDKELERMLEQLPDAVQKKVLRPALRGVAKLAKDEAVQRVPRDTGALARALKASRVRRPKGVKRNMVLYAFDMPVRGLLNIDPGDKWYYPAYVEYGHGNVPPHPYLRPAVDENYDRFIRYISSTMRVGIDREARKLAKR